MIVLTWLLSILPSPLYHIVVLLLVMSVLYLFNDNISDIVNNIFGDNQLSDETEGSTFFYDGAYFLILLDNGKKKKCWIQYDSKKKELKRIETKLSIICTKKEITTTYNLLQLSKIDLQNEALTRRENELVIQLHFQKLNYPLILIAGNPQVRLSWIKELQINLIKSKPELCHQVNEAIVKKITDKIERTIENVNSGTTLGLDEVQNVLKAFQISMTKSDLKLHLTKKIPKQQKQDNAYTPTELEEAIKCLIMRRDIQEIFEKLALINSNYLLLSIIDYHSMLTTTQGIQDISLLECSRHIMKHESLPLSDYLLISCHMFQELLTDTELDICNPIDPRELIAPSQLNRPLTDYFISSSHNTYLMEDQLKGRSDCAAYENALKKNCRCVEIDIHNGPNGDPIVTHGGTMTTKIRFEDVIKTIAKHAFTASEYPCILSFENHTGVEQQMKIVEYLQENFKDMLYLDENADSFETLPSPEELKYKIIIKNKKLPSSSFEEDAFGVIEEEFEEAGEGSSMDLPEDLNHSIVCTDIALEENEETQPNEAAEEQSETKSTSTPNKNGNKKKNSGLINYVSGKLNKPKKIHLAKELSDIVTICRAVKFKTCKFAQSHYKCTEMSSLVESKLHKKHWTGEAQETGIDFVHHTQYQLVRIYPMGLRTNSSNYNPCIGWVMGCQLVALNYQTAGAAIDTNDGLFQLQGGTGFVLKPDILTNSNTMFDPFGPYDPQLSRKIHLTILSAFNIRLSTNLQEEKDKTINPVVKINTYGVADDEKKDQTKKADSGLNPQWNHECFEENNVIKVPELAHLRFEVKDKNTSKTIGQFCAPLTSYLEGYRIITLKDPKGNSFPMLPPQLLVHLNITQIEQE